MTFQVRWTDRALEKLTTIWLQADSATRKLLTAVTNTTDLELGRDPFGLSESRAKRRRVAFFPPLAVYFRVEPDEQTVTVLYVHMYRTGRT